MFSTGYVANVSTISGLLHRHDYVVLDKDAHNSLLTGAQLSGATMKRFRHNDVDRLAAILGELPADVGKGVIVDGVYSMGGDTAPLDANCSSCATSTRTPSCSTTRPTGSACSANAGAARRSTTASLDDVDLITITFSKTLGSCGGALIGSADAIELLTLDSDPLIFTASNTPGSVAAALMALRILRRDPGMTERLRTNVDLFVDLLTERGVPVNPPESAIITIPLRQRDEVSTVMLARELLDAGVFVNPVIAPAVQRGLGLIRLSLMVDHTPAMLEEAAEVMLKVLERQRPAARRLTLPRLVRFASLPAPAHPLEALFPRLVARRGVLDERRPADRLDDDGVDRLHGATQLTHDVDEEHDARAVGVVPRLVLEDVVEHEALALRPVALSDRRRGCPTRSPGLGYEQTEVVAEHALVRAVVRRDRACPGRRSRTSRSSCPGSRSTSRVVSGHRSQLASHRKP